MVSETAFSVYRGELVSPARYGAVCAIALCEGGDCVSPHDTAQSCLLRGVCPRAALAAEQTPRADSSAVDDIHDRTVFIWFPL